MTLLTQSGSILELGMPVAAEATTTAVSGTTTEETQPASTATQILIQFLPWVFLLLLLYLIIFRPQKKKEKETAAMRENIQIGDEVLTIGGIVGLVVRKSEDTVVIETGGDRSKLRIKNWAIQENLTVHEEMKQAKAAKAAKKTKKEDAIEVAEPKDE